MQKNAETTVLEQILMWSRYLSLWSQERSAESWPAYRTVTEIYVALKVDGNVELDVGSKELQDLKVLRLRLSTVRYSSLVSLLWFPVFPGLWCQPSHHSPEIFMRIVIAAPKRQVGLFLTNPQGLPARQASLNDAPNANHPIMHLTWRSIRTKIGHYITIVACI